MPRGAQLSAGGKGSAPRPYSVPQEEFNRRHEQIFGKRPAKAPYVPPPLPSVEEKEQQDK
jgi:hypothetical protein